ncbi:hypothetical protein [Paenibacillus sp. SAFN-117]|uniref:hypothetical protein n=1 Tax=Paenibacillus sp. SAFN-117 TaxID=3436860 RepID=UPI003F7F9C78
MNKFTMFLNLFQSAVTEEEVKKIVAQVGYEDTARKCTVYQLVIVLCPSCIRPVEKLSTWCTSNFTMWFAKDGLFVLI